MIIFVSHKLVNFTDGAREMVQSIKYCLRKLRQEDGKFKTLPGLKSPSQRRQFSKILIVLFLFQPPASKCVNMRLKLYSQSLLPYTLQQNTQWKTDSTILYPSLLHTYIHSLMLSNVDLIIFWLHSYKYMHSLSHVYIEAYILPFSAETYTLSLSSPSLICVCMYIYMYMYTHTFTFLLHHSTPPSSPPLLPSSPLLIIHFDPQTPAFISLIWKESLLETKLRQEWTRTLTHNYIFQHPPLKQKAEN